MNRKERRDYLRHHAQYIGTDAFDWGKAPRWALVVGFFAILFKHPIYTIKHMINSLR